MTVRAKGSRSRRRRGALAVGGIAGLLLAGNSGVGPNAPRPVGSSHTGRSASAIVTSSVRPEAAAAVPARRLLGPAAWHAERPVAVALAARGGWWVQRDGHVSAFGGARALPTTGGRLTAPAVGIVATADGRGYWVVGRNGSVRASGDARFEGDAAAHPFGRAEDVVALAASADGRGYWLLSSQGGVDAFGDAAWRGSPVRQGLRGLFVGMIASPSGRGYEILDARGGVHQYGDAKWAGSLAAARPPVRAIGIAPAPSGPGYWIATAGGAVVPFGEAAHYSRLASTFRPLAGLTTNRDELGLYQTDGRVFTWRFGAPVTTLPSTGPVAGASGSGSSGGSGSGGSGSGGSGSGGGVTSGGSGSGGSGSGGGVTSGSPGGGTTSPVNAVAASEASFPLPFSPTSFWNTALPSGAPLATNSSALVNDFIQQYHQAYGTVGINTTSYSSADYTVPAGEADVAVKACPARGSFPSEMASELSAVPIPPGAISAHGTDADMIIYQPSTNREWELWQAASANGSWTACAGGEFTDVSQSSGVFPTPQGVAASGLSLLGGQIHLSDIANGSINHALEVQIPQTEAGTFVSPADRTDGWSTANDAIPEGTRFRLNPNIDLATLGLSPAALEIARALQTYGMVVSDTAGAVTFIAQDPSPQMAAGEPNPYDAWFGGTPSYEVLSNVPWQDLQAVSPATP